MAQVENGYRHNSQSVVHNGETVLLCFGTVFAAYFVFAANATLIPLPIIFLLRVWRRRTAIHLPTQFDLLGQLCAIVRVGSQLVAVVPVSSLSNGGADGMQVDFILHLPLCEHKAVFGACGEIGLHEFHIIRQDPLELILSSLALPDLYTGIPGLVLNKIPAPQGLILMTADADTHRKIIQAWVSFPSGVSALINRLFPSAAHSIIAVTLRLMDLLHRDIPHIAASCDVRVDRSRTAPFLAQIICIILDVVFELLKSPASVFLFGPLSISDGVGLVLFDRVFAGARCASFESGAFAQDLIFNTGHFLSSVFRNIIVAEFILSLLRLVPAVNI